MTDAGAVSQAEGGEQPIPGPAVLLTQVATAEALAATCALHGIDVVAVPSDIGAFAVTDSVTGPDLTQALSRSVPQAQFLLLTVNDDRLSAQKWTAGNRGEDVPAALILGSLPESVENVLLGADVADLPSGTVSSKKIGRFKAMRILAKSARAARNTASEEMPEELP